jgi:hypothetical protein
MTQEQITQNFDAGVGERFFLLFDISENIAAACSRSRSTTRMRTCSTGRISLRSMARRRKASRSRGCESQ